MGWEVGPVGDILSGSGKERGHSKLRAVKMGEKIYHKIGNHILVADTLGKLFHQKFKDLA